MADPAHGITLEPNKCAPAHWVVRGRPHYHQAYCAIDPTGNEATFKILVKLEHGGYTTIESTIPREAFECLYLAMALAKGTVEEPKDG